MRVLCFDTETTGLLPEDEIIQLSVADAITGEALYDKYFRPSDFLMERRWEGASAVTEIYPEDVINCPQITEPEHFAEIQALFDSADLVIGYHVAYDVKMMEHAGFDMSRYIYQDPSLSYPAYYWSHHPEDTDYGRAGSDWRADAPDGFGNYGRYTGRKLEDAAAVLCGITDFGAHNSMNDVNATNAVWRAMQEFQEQVYIRGLAVDEMGRPIMDDFGNPVYLDDLGNPMIDPNGRAYVYVHDYTRDELMAADDCPYISLG